MGRTRKGMGSHPEDNVDSQAELSQIQDEPSEPAAKRKKKQKNEPSRVMEGQTQDERREIRRKQGELQDQIVERTGDMGTIGSEVVTDVLLKNELLFAEVCYPRELLGNVENLYLVTKAASKQATNLERGVNRLDHKKIIFCMKDSFSHPETNVFDWDHFGGAVAVCFNSIPEASFMLGPLEKPIIEKKKPERKKIEADNSREIRAEENDKAESKGQENTLNETQIRIKKQAEILDKKLASKDERNINQTVDYFSHVVNPDSYIQTIENMFDLSFIVKDGKYEINTNSEGLPVICRGAEQSVDGMIALKKQVVMSFSMQDFKNVKEVFGIKESSIPPRKTYRKDALFESMMEGLDSQSQDQSQN